MKSWKKGFLLGGLWGLFSFILSQLLLYRPPYCPECTAQIATRTYHYSTITKVFLLPAYVASLRLKKLIFINESHIVAFATDSILIGALIGLIIGYVIGKIQSAKDEKLRAWKKGAVLGAIWGLINPILYWVLIDFKSFWIKTVLQIIALPLFIYYKIFIPQSAPGGSFYYSPLIVLPVSVAIGTLIGYGVEKVYQKVKGK